MTPADRVRKLAGIYAEDARRFRATGEDGWAGTYSCFADVLRRLADEIDADTDEAVIARPDGAG
jgi:hypothetical protein